MAPKPVPQARLDTFISYSNGDAAFAYWLAITLSHAGFTVFYDGEGLSAGDSLPRKIRAAIAATQWVTLLVSPSAVESAWVRREIEWAQHNAVPIVPVALGPVPEEQWLPAIRDLVRLDRSRLDLLVPELWRRGTGRRASVAPAAAFLRARNATPYTAFSLFRLICEGAERYHKEGLLRTSDDLKLWHVLTCTGTGGPNDAQTAILVPASSEEFTLSSRGGTPVDGVGRLRMLLHDILAAIVRALVAPAQSGEHPDWQRSHSSAIDSLGRI